METTTLQAEVRESRGKGPARRLRAQGKIPGVFYGPGVEPTPLTLPPKPLERALRGERGRNTVFILALNGKDELAMVKDLTVDPVSRELLHADFYRVDESREIKVQIPLHTTGRAAGVIKGGVLNVTRRSIPVVTTPAKIPARIEIDVSDLELHQTISVQELDLPEGVECTLRSQLTLATVLEAKKVVEEEIKPEAGEEGEAAAAATPEGEAASGAPSQPPPAAGGDDKK